MHCSFLELPIYWIKFKERINLFFHFHNMDTIRVVNGHGRTENSKFPLTNGRTNFCPSDTSRFRNDIVGMNSIHIWCEGWNCYKNATLTSKCHAFARDLYKILQTIVFDWFEWACTFDAFESVRKWICHRWIRY